MAKETAICVPQNDRRQKILKEGKKAKKRAAVYWFVTGRCNIYINSKRNQGNY